MRLMAKIRLAASGFRRMFRTWPAKSRTPCDPARQRGAMRCSHMWSAVTLIVDEVTRSGAGEIEVTAVLMLATKIIRAGGFWKGQTQHP